VVDDSHAPNERLPETPRAAAARRTRDGGGDGAAARDALGDAARLGGGDHGNHGTIKRSRPM